MQKYISFIQTAGELRLAAQRILGGFDNTGDQLYMSSDTIQVARHGEKPATNQDPFSAHGQIACNGFYLKADSSS